LISLTSAAGCGTSRDVVKAEQRDIFHEDAICEINELQKEKYEGSLWNADGPMSDIFMDAKARRVGDIVTILVVEDSSASNNANTNTSRSSSLSMKLSNFLGLENNDRFPSGSGFDPFGSITGSTNNDFSGTGSTNRSGKLDATITARVTEVFPNGNLKIMGRREITINNEKQYIVLNGIIRSRDISADNIILSTSIADARIAYSGQGVINDRQDSGWLARILDTVWPF
jgi:flagellar L-ring protein precursor FlgH